MKTNTLKTIILSLVAAVFSATSVRAEDALPSWNDGPTKQSIVDFVAKVTKPGSPDGLRAASFRYPGPLANAGCRTRGVIGQHARNAG